ncbi:hypothetical protein L218DRAFT_955718 [Marasmius fiardii PR-910]|nr:hypothetical protein L218DRAFT_955718 [Marasmius fiardii PR-910]
MPSTTTIATLASILLAVGIYRAQEPVKEAVFTNFGVARKMQPVSDFPYTCRLIRHEKLEGCEDIWLDHHGRKLYAACSSVSIRAVWNPNMDVFNPSYIRPDGDRISILDIDSPFASPDFGLRTLSPSDPSTGYVGPLGPTDRRIGLLGFDVLPFPDSQTLRFFIINYHPPVNEARTAELDATIHGANATIEIFDLDQKSNRMKHVYTIVHDLIRSPNNIAITADGKGFLITNDHSNKVGFHKKLEVLLGGGDVVYCSLPTSSSPSSCHTAASTEFKFAFPNGLVRGFNFPHSGNLFLVPNALNDQVYVMQLNSSNLLSHLPGSPIRTGMPIDNLAIDASGDIYGAGLPKGWKLPLLLDNAAKLGKQNTSEINVSSQWPSAVLRIRSVNGYKVEKVIETDSQEGIDYLVGATSATHDIKTGRIFTSGILTNGITVCDRKK